MDINEREKSQGRQLDMAPPRPPRNRQSMMSMAGGDSDSASSLGIDMSNPAVRAMKLLGDARKDLLELSTVLPGLASGVQQFIAGLEAVVSQQLADLVSGNPPGSGGSSMGAPSAAPQAPVAAPQVQTGMP